MKLPATINGQIAPGGVDRYRFHRAQGQQLIISVDARGVDSVSGRRRAGLVRGDAGAFSIPRARKWPVPNAIRFHPDP